MLPTGTEAVTVFVAVSITETLLSYLLLTYTFAPSGVTATPSGTFPTSTVAVTVFVAVSITATWWSAQVFPTSVFATYAFVPSGVTTIPLRRPGAAPTGTVAVIVLVFVLITMTVG
jgi:hypothetical protein